VPDDFYFRVAVKHPPDGDEGNAADLDRVAPGFNDRRAHVWMRRTLDWKRSREETFRLRRFLVGFAVLVLVAILLGGCVMARDHMVDAHSNSGIDGLVTFGPTGPLARPGVVNYRPYQAVIAVLDDKGQTVTRSQSGVDGRFQVRLKPGRYVLCPEKPSGIYPRADRQLVNVSEGAFTSIQINYDSGIR
jgi:hypothetical protein